MTERFGMGETVTETKLYDDDFCLGNPALVCRWRLAGGKLPMANRHLRCLGRRHLNDVPLKSELVAWAKQHIEWALDAGSSAYPDGVLMLIVDERGRAAMSVGPFEPLPDTRLASLLGRVDMATREGRETGVCPETLCVVSDGVLCFHMEPEFLPGAATTLITDLVKTLGLKMLYEEDLLDAVRTKTIEFEEAFLISDEYGVVRARDFKGIQGKRLAGGYAKLLERTRG